ncbi:MULTISPECIES: GntT/GntP/DsdX family permease [unclassified Arthrobacter]|jgi:GntP family gluconate:H+ symporter|uniref:GntP family gluconate:H+ symporter n=3 Tax=Arthrobacter TaxID=1663 RepID=A0AAW8DE47_9MICC|nr:GntP family gluconate:H+ symporter [Arthrobacter bambusae]MDQ0128662.1 GntP family gluconate:H+ symporter [Arthrobacter bambusae]MDQ0180003.1 GntP family gluconate:H+ symporter [Arthrobacter bambusae]
MNGISILSRPLAGVATDATTDAMHQPWTGHDTQVLVVAAIGIAIVVLLIVWAKMHAFLALSIGALFVGIASGISLDKVTTSYENGVGGVLGYVGVLIALGAMLGKLLADSGGADKIVDTLLHGRPATLPWKMALIAGIIGIPMFFEIGLVLLIPVVMLAVHRSKGPAMRLGIPALAGLSVLHGFIPPHPGPLAAIGILHANVGVTLAFGLLIAIPTVIIAGPLFGRLAARIVPIGAAGAGLAVTVGAGENAETARSQGPGAKAASSRGDAPVGKAQDPQATRSPSFGWTLVTLLSPLVLMLIKAGADIWMDKNAPLRPLLDFIGDPVFALLVAVLLAMVTFGTRVGFSASILTKKIGESLLPIVGVMLIVGAGGGFKQVLVDGGTGTAIAKIAVAASLSALVLGWIIAVLIRLATGSATVATVTAAGIIAPLATGLSPAQLALVVLAIGAGSLFFSHVNDAGFWLVKEYFGLTVGQTIKTWSVMETIISVVGFGFTLLLSVFV